MERKTMRPVTLRRVIEICSLATKTEKADITIISQKLRVGRSRAKEIILEVIRMALLESHDDAYTANANTIKFLDYFENEHWNKIHEYFLANYKFYQNFIRILEDHINNDKGLSLNEIKEESTKRKLNLNQTAVEVLSDWCDRLGVVQRHLYTGRLYLIRYEETSFDRFENALKKYYRELSFSHGRKGVFVDIPKIREDTCEQLKITRKGFDEMLRQTYLQNIGRIELSGAPIITLAKKSPLSEKKIKFQGRQTMLSPKFELTRKREGLLVGQKAYYYLAMHEDI